MPGRQYADAPLLRERDPLSAVRSAGACVESRVGMLISRYEMGTRYRSSRVLLADYHPIRVRRYQAGADR